jgi:hypothetical protein
MSQGTHCLSKRLLRILLAGAFLVTCAPAIMGQCLDAADRRRNDPEPFQQPRTTQRTDYCDPQVLQAPGIIYQPCRRCEEGLPLKQIKEDRESLEFLSQSVFGSGGSELGLESVSQWAGELRKRVRRLKANLALPEAEEPPPSMSEAARVPSNRHELASAVNELSRLTSESLRNPVLNGRVLDQALSAKAVRDLAQIDSLAGLIQNGCQLLSKTSR